VTEEQRNKFTHPSYRQVNIQRQVITAGTASEASESGRGRVKQLSS